MGVRLRLSKPDLLEDLLLFGAARLPSRQLDVDLIDAEVPTRSTPSRRGWNSTSTSQLEEAAGCESV